MDYVIKNSRQVFIKLDKTGKPVSCTEPQKQLFEYSKAKNICKSLPKGLQHLNFKVVALPDIVQNGNGKKKIQKSGTPDKTGESVTTIQAESYEVSQEIMDWREKFETCDEIISEARDRHEELRLLMIENEKKTADLVHKIELEKNKDMYNGYLIYTELRDLRRNRRKLKDEWIILGNIIHMNFSKFKGEEIDKAIAGLAKRKYSLRIVEDGSDVDGNNNEYESNV